MFYDIDHKYRVEARNDSALMLLQKRIDEINHLFSDHDRNEGERLYKHKSSGITWTDETYRNKDFQYTYILTKLAQRYAETWNIFEQLDTQNMNVYSVGGGPGLELLALKDLGVRSTLSLDLPYWKSVTEKLDVEFQPFNFFSDDLQPIMKDGCNVIYLSYVYSNYMNDIEGIKLIKYWLSFADMIVINDRGILKSLDGFAYTYRINGWNDDSMIIITKKFQNFNFSNPKTFNVWNRQRSVFSDKRIRTIKYQSIQQIQKFPDAIISIDLMNYDISVWNMLVKMKRRLFFVGDVSNQYMLLRAIGTPYSHMMKYCTNHQ